MSVLLLGPTGPDAESVVDLLVREGDQVGIVVADGDREGWRRRGAYVAQGDPAEADMIYRSAQQARSIVLFQEGLTDVGGVVAAILEAAPALAEAPRVIVLGPPPDDVTVQALRSSPLDYVVLVTEHRGRLGRRRRVEPERVAAAVNAADDLDGNPRLALDLDTSDAWSKLGL